MCIRCCALGALAAALVLGSAAALAGPSLTTSERTSRDEILAFPPPYPFNRVDSPDRVQNGRLWVSTHPIGPERIGPPSSNPPGPASVGAPREWDDVVIYVDVAHVPVAISPWETYPDAGFERYRRARNLWLREQGYVQRVRTHVNARYLHEGETRVEDSPRPRATIRVHPESRGPRKMEAALPGAGGAITRISKPHGAAGSALFIVQPSSERQRAEADGE
jgi:hypothetical protein